MVYGKRANRDDRDESQISEADWETTPASVKKLVEVLMEEVTQLKVQVAVLEEKLGKNSKNLSKALSGDEPEEKKGKEEGKLQRHSDTR
jgi:hypothetical protein